MLEFDFEALSALGLTPALASRAAVLAAEVGREGSSAVSRASPKSTARRWPCTTDATERSARPLPRLVRALAEEATALAVGDWVLGTVDDATVSAGSTQRVPPDVAHRAPRRRRAAAIRW